MADYPRQVDNSNREALKLIRENLSDGYKKGIKFLLSGKFEYVNRKKTEDILDVYRQNYHEEFVGVIKKEDDDGCYVYEFINCLPKETDRHVLTTIQLYDVGGGSVQGVKFCNPNNEKYFTEPRAGFLSFLKDETVFLGYDYDVHKMKQFKYFTEEKIINSSIYIDETDLWYELFDIDDISLEPKFYFPER